MIGLSQRREHRGGYIDLLRNEKRKKKKTNLIQQGKSFIKRHN